MKVTREAHVAARSSSKETETETLHSATEAENRERHRDQRPRRGRVSQKVSSKSADQVVVNYRSGAGPATTP